MRILEVLAETQYSQANCGSRQSMTEGKLEEIDYAQALDSSNFPHNKVIEISTRDGEIDGHDVLTASVGNQTVYFLTTADKKISAFLGFENNYLKNIKNFTNTPGVVRALLGYLVHIRKKNIKISPDEPLTSDGLRWVAYLVQRPRGLKITDQNGAPIDIEALRSEWQQARDSGKAGPTGISIGEDSDFGDKLRINEASRQEKSIIMPRNYYLDQSRKI
jgi:hypothetical protein